jgi:HSP20 family protein
MMIPLVTPRAQAATLRQLRREMDRWLEAGGAGNGGQAAAWLPAMDVVETPEEIRCVVEVPGLAQDELELSIEGNTLQIAGEKRPVEQEGGAYRVAERRYGRFARQLTLPRHVDAARIVARYQDGLLVLTLPKAAEAQPRRIPIEGFAAGNGTRAPEPTGVEAGTGAA